jgi:pimeloyl-ACP methyl ester carboxylesterase
MNKILFMIHGMMVGPWCWDNYRDYFTKKNYRCISPALRFHDMDPNDIPAPQLGTTSLLDYVADLEREINECSERPIIMGHSMGGLLAQILASRGYAKAAVLLTPAAPAGIIGLNYTVLRSFSGAMMNWGFWRKPFRFSFPKAVYATMHLLPVEEQRRIYKRFVYESGRAASQIGFWFLDRTGASRVDQSRVNCPLLLISGKKDRITPAVVVQRTAQKYTSASYKQFDDHAHWVLSEPGWQEIAEYIDGWLECNSHNL